jgi:hypothetical protein
MLVQCCLRYFRTARISTIAFITVISCLLLSGMFVQYCSVHFSDTI